MPVEGSRGHKRSWNPGHQPKLRLVTEIFLNEMIAV
jgi:hypothetical protein